MNNKNLVAWRFQFLFNKSGAFWKKIEMKTFGSVTVCTHPYCQIDCFTMFVFCLSIQIYLIQIWYSSISNSCILWYFCLFKHAWFIFSYLRFTAITAFMMSKDLWNLLVRNFISLVIKYVQAPCPCLQRVLLEFVQIFLKFSTLDIILPPTQNYNQAFKFRSQFIFNLLEKTQRHRF